MFYLCIIIANFIFYCNLISLNNYLCKHIDCTQRFKSYGEALSAGIDKALLYI